MTNKSKKPTVAIGVIHPGEVRGEFADSLAGSFLAEASNQRNRIRNYISIMSGPRISHGRTQVVQHFLASRCQWLWMIDADMCWEPDALDRLLDRAHSSAAQIIGGLCFGGRGGFDSFPTLYRIEQDEHNRILTEPIVDYPVDELIQVGATGAAFLLVHRSVFLRMRDEFRYLESGLQNPYPWFVEASNGGIPYGEDIAFCLRAQALGIPVHVDTSIKVGHIKHVELSESTYLAERAAANKE